MHAPPPTAVPAAPAAVVPSPAMPEHERGREARRQILAELARLYLEFEPTPSIQGLSDALGMSRGSIEFHVAKLRALNLVHPSALWITRAGLDWIQGHGDLTN